MNLMMNLHLFRTARDLTIFQSPVGQGTPQKQRGKMMQKKAQSDRAEFLKEYNYIK